MPTLRDVQISDDDWQAMVAELANYSRSRRWKDFAWHASRMSILDPERFREIEITDVDWDALISDLSKAE